MLIGRSAKYIEGLENRLGRMESLLKLSGLLNEEDGDRTDLGTLEKRLADKSQTQSQSNDGTPQKSPGRSPEMASQAQSSNSPHLNTPQSDRRHTPKSPIGSPETQKENEEEVEALSDMMCSLVTNNCGESKYIGRYCATSFCFRLRMNRLVLGVLNILAQRYTVGE